VKTIRITTVLGLPLPDVIAGLVVAIAFLMGLAVAYRRGFHAALPLRCDDLDFLSVGVDLEGTRWKRTETQEAELPQSLELQQAGSRLAGTGSDPTGTVWQMEGVIHGSHVECLTRRVRGGDVQPEVWMLHVDAKLQEISGYRIGWDPGGARMALRELNWVRDDEAVQPSAEPEATEHAAALVVASEPT
jgi:hypothetical protein